VRARSLYRLLLKYPRTERFKKSDWPKGVYTKSVSPLHGEYRTYAVLRNDGELLEVKGFNREWERV
jgi:hypothetical protein